MLPASIPSPSDNALDLGPVSLHVYGLLLAVGVIAAALMAERRWARWGHDRQAFQRIVVVVVICGIVGARLYHVVTDYQLFEDDWARVFEIWEGGLSIWGAVLGGAAGVVVMTRRLRVDTLTMMDAIAPALLVAQAIGRWGNYVNQELFGKPSTLPWALEIDPAHRPAGYEQFATFHPVFLYESLYCIVLLAVLMGVERRFVLRRGQTFAAYVALYPLGRFFFELLRIDEANEILGMRVNAWVSLVVFAAGAAWFVWLARHGTVDAGRYPGDGARRSATPGPPPSGPPALGELA